MFSNNKEEIENEEPPSAYKETTWGKEFDGENIVDGYNFRGKRSFDRALQGLKEVMVRGFKEEINGVEFKVLDARKKGVELEIEIEMVEGKNKGVAMQKLYGPNKRKENVVLVSKSKGSDYKFVDMLAQRVI